MANLAVTISETITVFGPAPSNKWLEYVWNAFKWGEGNNKVALSFDVLFADSQAITDTLGTEAVFNWLFSDNMSPNDVIALEELSDAAGYSYVFVDNVTNGEDRSFASWIKGTPDTETWTSGTAGSTTWS